MWWSCDTIMSADESQAEFNVDYIYPGLHFFRQLEYGVDFEKATVEQRILELVAKIFNSDNPPTTDNVTPCINIPRRLTYLVNKPNLRIYGQLWRWTHIRKLRAERELSQFKPDRTCYSAIHGEICLNPLHYLRKSRSTSGLAWCPPLHPWATIAYYEKSRKLETFQCFPPEIRVTFNTVPGVGCFNLEGIQNELREDEVANTRRQIGDGIFLYYENGQVVVQLLSDSGVYIQSIYCNRIKNHGEHTLHWLQSFDLRSMKLMDDDKFHILLDKAVQEGVEAVYELAKIFTIRVVFVDYWSTNTPVTDYNCWIEIRLCRQMNWLDNALRQMGAPCV
ncbi:mothers against decapentaplegic homolog 5-like [Zophobas morio]|uniref:mothers against decapentaplegic homolog 5-like n=1 Tax=Zophobas morio TaxID=2755281 RepID=UPI003083B8D6